MLTMEDLISFENALRSGQLEECFKCGTEQTRHEILELLEKLMDVAELADEVATRLIFRGLPGMAGSLEKDGDGDGSHGKLQ